MARGIQIPFSFQELQDFNEVRKVTEKDYQDYLKLVKAENDCYKETGHRNQKWNGIAGCYVCLDCGCWGV